MIKANVQHGGDLRNTSGWRYARWDAPFYVGFNRTPLGVLARLNIPADASSLTPEVQADLDDAVQVLSEGAQNPSKTRSTALLDAISSQNMPIARSLVQQGTNPKRSVNVGEPNPYTKQGL
jgi:hypothetical protein